VLLKHVLMVVSAGESFAGAFEAATELAAREGRTFIHAFNDAKVVAGQGVMISSLVLV
jgi:threonine dehydratase